MMQLRMPDETQKLLFKFNNIETLQDWLVGSDADLGGYSEAYWGLTPENTALFWGTISTKVPEGLSIERSGYAGIRSKEKELTLFHRPRIDTSMFRYLKIRAKGDKRDWMVNIRTDSVFPTFIWQHRLFFRTPGEFETILIPFRDFVRTSHGYVQPQQLRMNREKVKTIGFSVVRQPGDFSLEIDSISLYNSPNTLGDFDVLDYGQYIDKDGFLKRLRPGESPPSILDRVQWFAPNDKNVNSEFKSKKATIDINKKT
ncbi:complex I intermediate-associated protein 30-domain-containing protein [Globomyces pollinis-pini]|nr:complex I intermediate-associated protein 30-domain-containing protein [Globomyces pollinis-pini]